MPPAWRIAVIPAAALTALGAAAPQAAAVTPTNSTSVTWHLSYQSNAGGYLKATGTANGPAGRIVDFQRYYSGAWHTLKSGPTTSTHTFSVKAYSTSAATYTLRVYVPASGSYKSKAGVTTSITTHLNSTAAHLSVPSTITWGHTATLKFTGTTFDSTRTVSLQKLSSGSWTTIASKTVTASKAGTCISGSTAKNLCTTFSWAAPSWGTTTLRAVVAKTSLSSTGISGEHPSTVVLASPSVVTGKAFDTASAPSLATMNAWWGTSPYKAVGVYIGGVNRFDTTQANLTPDWVTSVSRTGWKLIPTYMGSQPYCTTNTAKKIRFDATTAKDQGSADGADAANAAAALGIRTGSPIYVDIENYNAGDTICSQAVLTYVRNWDLAVHKRGYWAGFYSSGGSGVADMAKAASADPPATGLPDVMWYADWNHKDDTTSTSYAYLPDTLWTGHRRGHQYETCPTTNYCSKETWGSDPTSYNLDHDAWDAPVAVVG
jgi:hypothetical protein